jgi:hypothetical protein
LCARDVGSMWQSEQRIVIAVQRHYGHVNNNLYVRDSVSATGGTLTGTSTLLEEYDGCTLFCIHITVHGQVPP